MAVFFLLLIKVPAYETGKGRVLLLVMVNLLRQWPTFTKVLKYVEGVSGTTSEWKQKYIKQGKSLSKAKIKQRYCNDL